MCINNYDYARNIVIQWGVHPLYTPVNTWGDQLLLKVVVVSASSAPVSVVEVVVVVSAVKVVSEVASGRIGSLNRDKKSSCNCWGVKLRSGSKISANWTFPRSGSLASAPSR